MPWFPEKQVQMNANFTTFLPEIPYYLLLFHSLFCKSFQLNCSDISGPKFRFPDKNNLFACLQIFFPFKLYTLSAIAFR